MEQKFGLIRCIET
jgi:hypothetical protein